MSNEEEQGYKYHVCMLCHLNSPTSIPFRPKAKHVKLAAVVEAIGRATSYMLHSTVGYFQ